jgi:hypothetical protein
MQLRYHPLMSYQGRPIWPPIWISLESAGTGDEEILEGEMGHLKRLRCEPTDPRCIFLIMVHEEAEYVGCLLFNDDLSCEKIAQRLRKLYGVAIKAIGSSDCLSSLHL